MPKSNIDCYCNPDASALNRALLQYVRLKWIERSVELIRLHGVARRLRGKLNRATYELLERD